MKIQCADIYTMVNINYIYSSGDKVSINVPEIGTIMEAAKFNDVNGIDADCGGSCACATCLVNIDPGWIDKIPHPSEMESEMLLLSDNSTYNSRLSCQINITASMDGIIIHIPPHQSYAASY
jgi:2Fe-2S ferredoxin